MLRAPRRCKEACDDGGPGPAWEGLPENRDLPAGAGRPEMNGEFGLALHSLLRNYDPAGPTLGDTLEAGRRRSNAFMLR